MPRRSSLSQEMARLQQADLGSCAHHSPTGFVPWHQGFRAGHGSHTEAPRRIGWLNGGESTKIQPSHAYLAPAIFLPLEVKPLLSYLSSLLAFVCHVSPSVLHVGVGSKKGKENWLYLEEGRHLAQTELWETRGGRGCWRRRQDQNAGLWVPVLAGSQLFLKGQKGNTFGFMSSMVSATTTQLCHCSRKQR